MFEVSKEILDSHEALLEIVFEDEVVEEAKRQAAREIAREVEIPGFRKGRAPYAKVAQVVGEPAILQEAAEHLLNEHYAEFLEEADVSPYGAGEFVDMDTSPLTFRIKVPLEPTVDLGDYRDLREEWVPPTVSEEEVDQVLEQVREEHAVLEPVDRPAELGDEILVDVQATVDGDVIVDEEDIEAVLSEERPFLSVEFVQALIGISVDEERTFTATLPETIEEPSLRGVEAEFTVKTKQIYERRLPELDDALASTVGSFETLEELVEDIRERILSSKREQAETAYRSQLVDKLVEEAEIAYPPQIIEDTLDDMVEEARNRLRRQQGQMSLEDALRLEGRTVEQLREEMRPQAERRVARSLVLHEFAEQEDIEVSDDEVVQEYSDLLDQMGLGGRMPEAEVDVDSKLGRDLQSNVLGRKVMSRLARLGRGELEGVEPVEDAETPEAVDVAEEATEEITEETPQEVAPEAEAPASE